jgi:hypothetical protein
MATAASTECASLVVANFMRDHFMLVILFLRQPSIRKARYAEKLGQLLPSPKTSELEFVMGRMDFGTRFWTRDSLVGNWSSLPGAPAGS